MATRGTIRMADWGKEPTSVSFYLQDIGAANYATVTQDLDEIKDACLAFLGGSVLAAQFTKEFPEPVNAASGVAAQREQKWVLSYRDDTQFLDVANTIANPGFGKIFQVEFGTALLTDGVDTFLSPNTDLANTDIEAVQDFIDVILPNIRSPYNHSAAVAPTHTFIELRHVGRNS